MSLKVVEGGRRALNVVPRLEGWALCAHPFLYFVSVAEFTACWIERISSSSALRMSSLLAAFFCLVRRLMACCSASLVIFSGSSTRVAMMAPINGGSFT